MLTCRGEQRQNLVYFVLPEATSSNHSYWHIRLHEVVVVEMRYIETRARGKPPLPASLGLRTLDLGQHIQTKYGSITPRTRQRTWDNIFKQHN